MFADPKKNIEQFAFHSGMTIADLGAGSGAYSLLAARTVGDLGKVYAIDVQKELLQRIKNDAIKEHLSNIEVVWGDIEKMGGTSLKDDLIDGAIVSNLLFQLQHKDIFRNEVHRILKPEGRVFVIDWTDSFGGIGPHPESVFSLVACRELFKEGFVVDKEFNAGTHHYGIIFKKQ